MTDIVKRLRKGSTHGVLIPCEDLTEAADEIERLRAQLSASADGKGAGEPFGYLIEKSGINNGYYFHTAAEFDHVEERFRYLYRPVWTFPPPDAQADGKGAEPVAWLVPSDETGLCRIWWRDKERADAWIAKHPTCTLVPLYAAPPSPPAAQMREALRHAQVRFECLADEFEKAGDTASWAMCRVDAGRMFKALSALPKPAVETEEALGSLGP